ncbi:MAG TPA: VOC family protein [Candidatus Saccharimonadales bacterium]|nr:VOC family protein [Candidatus Saccharimonadales bacterium]
MSVVLNPYLHFNGNAKEALEFYKSIFGGKLSISHYSDFPGMPEADKYKDQVMHGALEAGSLQLMASDSGPMGEGTIGDNFSLSLSGDDEPTLRKHFEALSAGGTVTQPLATQVWGDTFGMLKDKFGMTWFVNIAKPKS